MFGYLIGEVTQIELDSVILENQQIGYKLMVSAVTSRRLTLGDTAKLHTKLVVREEDLSLLGFYTEEEMQLYDLLVTVSKVGPKLALSVLSAFEPSSLKNYIVAEDIPSLSSIPGIGKKTAERIILELKDKVKKMGGSLGSDAPPITLSASSASKEAVEALLTLGFSRTEISSVVQQLLSVNPQATADELIKKALPLIGRL